MKRIALLTVGLLASAFASTAFAQTDDTIRIAVAQEPPAFDICAMGSNAASRIIFGNIGEGLTERNPTTGEVKPLLATAWEQTGENTWVFTLRDGVKFHDGTPFDADAAVKSIARTFTKELNCSVASQAFGAVRLTAKALEPTKLEITTSQADPILPLRASFLGMTAPATETDKQTENPIGTGPYKLVSWARGEQIEVERFADYWGTAPAAAKITYLIRPEDLVRAEMVGTGEADVAVGLPPEFAEHEGAIQFQVAETVGLRIHLQSPPFNDKRVRQAAVLALDRQGLIEAVWNGAAEPASQPITSDVVGYDPSVPPPVYDVEAAKALVAAAKADGVPVDTEATIFARLDVVDNGDLLAQALAEQFTAVGLNVKVQVMEAAPWIELLRSHPSDKPGFLLEPHNNNLGDASWTANSKYSSSQARSQNRGADADKADALIKSAGAATGEERAKLYQELFKFLRDDVVTDVFICHIKAVMIVGPRLQYTPNALSNDIVRVSEITFK